VNGRDLAAVVAAAITAALILIVLSTLFGG